MNGYLCVARHTADLSVITKIMSILIDMDLGTVHHMETISLVAVNILLLEHLCQHYYCQQLHHRQTHPPLVVDQDGFIVIISVIILISVLVLVGQLVNWHALHWMPPCCVLLILQRIVGYPVLVLYLHGLVTLIYQIRMATISGYLDAALHTPAASSITTIIVLT